jgi:very-short-patch-repair endonuclease
VLDEERLETCLEQALYERLLELPELDARLKQVGGKGRKGAGVLRFSTCAIRGAHLLRVRSKRFSFASCERLTCLCRERQHSVWDDQEFVTRIDFAYPEARIAIPVDSYKWHSRRRVWEKDMERRNRLQALDWRVRPTTSGELRYQPERLTADVARLLRLPWPEVCSATGILAPFSYIPGDSAPRQDDRRSLMYFVSTGNSVYRTMAPTATGRAKMTSSLSRNVNARPAPAASADHMYNTMTA